MKMHRYLFPCFAGFLSLALILSVPQPSNAALKAVVSGVAQTFTNAACTGAPSVCGAFFGYSNPVWYGATCPTAGGHDDTPAMKLAMAAAVTGGWNTVALPVPPAKCLFLDNLLVGADGFLVTVAGPEFGTTYNGDAPTGTIAYLNSGFQHGTINGLFDMNGHRDFYTSGFTIQSDGQSIGSSGIYNSFNTTTSAEPQPRWHGRNMSFTQIGVAVGCPVKTSGVASGAPQCDVTGTIGNNLITGDCVNCDANESGVVSLGNMTDLRWNGGSIAAMKGGFFANANNINLQICPDRLENSTAGAVSGMFSANLPMVGVSGSGWEVCSNTIIRANQGPAYGFYTGASRFQTKAHEEGNGLGGGVEMAEFNIASGSPSAFDFTGVTVGGTGITPATNLTKNPGAVAVTYNWTGGAGGALAYSGTRDNASVSAITANIMNVLGELNNITGDLTVNSGNGIFNNLIVNTGVLKFQAPAAVSFQNGSVSGSCQFQQPIQGSGYAVFSYKKVMAYCNALSGTASYTFPSAYSNTPAIITTNTIASAAVTSLSTTAVTITGAGAVTGYIFLEGN